MLGSFQFIIGTTGTGASFEVPVDETQTHSREVGSNQRVLRCWYHPVDNVSNLRYFSLLDVQPDPTDPGRVSFEVRANRAAVILHPGP